MFRISHFYSQGRLLRNMRATMNSSVAELPRDEAHVLKGHEGAVLAVRFNGDGNYCLSCGKDRTLRLWNPHRGIHIKTYKSHGREVRDVHVTSYINQSSLFHDKNKEYYAISFSSCLSGSFSSVIV